MALAEDMARLADEIRQDSEDLKTEVNMFPSGAVSLRVKASGRGFDLDYLLSYGMFGVDELEADAGFDSGYRFGSRDFESAKAKMRELLREALPRLRQIESIAENPGASRVTIPS